MSKQVRFVVEGGVIAALYVILTLIMPFTLPGSVELRLSEALTLMPVLTPAAVPGLAVGCLVANLVHGATALDVIFGSLATLIAAAATYFLRKNIWVAALMPAVSNGVIVGLLLRYAYRVNMPLYVLMLSVAAGEAIICYALGVPMIRGLQKTKLF
jgi:uncharacterized membrane protein